MRRALPWLLALAPALACDQAGSSLLPLPVNDGLPADCNPLRVPGSCLTPWPSAIYLKDDPSTVTGFRVDLDPATLPVVNVSNTPLDTTRANMADGFSPAASLIAYFAERIDPASLVPEDDVGASLQPGASTAIVDMSTHQLVAHFSIVDENVRYDTDRQGLLITPVTRLLPAHRYAVAITKAVRTLAGGAPTPPPLFQDMLQGFSPDDPQSHAQLSRMPAIVASLAAAGVPQSQLVVAWDFVTSSDESLTAHVLSMRDQALTAAGPDGGGYTITEVDDHLDATTLRRILGTFTVPQFIDNADETIAKTSLSFDAAGNPVLIGTYQAPFTVIIPAVAATKSPLPIVVYGHGIFGSGEGELGGASGSYVQDFANQAGVIVVATDWIGLSSHENPIDAGNNQALSLVLANFSNLPWITDRLQQALVNNMVLVRTMRERIASDPAMTVSGKVGGVPVSDPTRVRYYGVSLGAIMGLSFMGYDPDVTQAALGNGGGFWSALFQRSFAWSAASTLIHESYPDPLDVQLMLQLAQTQFDYSDPATVAPYVLHHPLRGVPPKQILAQMGLYDSMVSNVTSEMIARTEGLPLLSPSVTAPWGMTPTGGPLASGISTWDVNGEPRPADTNATPKIDNLVHEAIRRIPQVEQQIEQFWDAGVVVDTCGGKPCVEPVPPATPEAGLP